MMRRGKEPGVAGLPRAIAALAVLACLAACRYHPLPRAELSRYKSQFERATGALVGSASLLHMGHRGGCSNEYPTSPAAGSDVTELVERSFGELGLDAVEVDVRLVHETGFLTLVHDSFDPAELSPLERARVQRNSLAGLLAHFARSEHLARGKRILLDLKGPGEWNEWGREGQALVQALADLFEGLEFVDARVRRQLTFLAFNPRLLRALEARLGSADARPRFYLNATSDRFPGWVFALLSRYPPLDDEMTELLCRAEWLDGVMFDPYWVEDFATTFARIQAARREAGLPWLDLNLVTYGVEFSEFEVLLREGGRQLETPLPGVTGFLHEIAPE